MALKETYVRARIDVKVPNTRTRKAMAELEAGRGRRVANVKALMADLSARD